MNNLEILPYKFERKSNSFYDWLGNIVKSNHFATTDPVLISNTTIQ